MSSEGPILESLMRRMAECPPEFLLPPRVHDQTSGGVGGSIDVAAIVCDLLRSLNAPLPLDAVERFGAAPTPARINRLRLIALASWLLHDDWFRQRPSLGVPVSNLLARELDALAMVVNAADLATDADRREELIRVCLKSLGLRPLGETSAQAADRLATFDSSERQRIMRQTRDAEARAREIREQMARKAAEAAAARYSPE